MPPTQSTFVVYKGVHSVSNLVFYYSKVARYGLSFSSGGFNNVSTNRMLIMIHC